MQYSARQRWPSPTRDVRQTAEEGWPSPTQAHASFQPGNIYGTPDLPNYPVSLPWSSSPHNDSTEPAQPDPQNSFPSLASTTRTSFSSSRLIQVPYQLTQAPPLINPTVTDSNAFPLGVPNSLRYLTSPSAVHRQYLYDSQAPVHDPFTSLVAIGPKLNTLVQEVAHARKKAEQEEVERRLQAVLKRFESPKVVRFDVPEETPTSRNGAGKRKASATDQEDAPVGDVKRRIEVDLRARGVDPHAPSSSSSSPSSSRSGHGLDSEDATMDQDGEGRSLTKADAGEKKREVTRWQRGS
jgi:hypothetical protein